MRPEELRMRVARCKGFGRLLAAECKKETEKSAYVKNLNEQLITFGVLVGILEAFVERTIGGIDPQHRIVARSTFEKTKMLEKDERLKDPEFGR